MTDQIETPVEDSNGATETEEALDNTVTEGDDQSAPQTDEEQELPEILVYDIEGEEVSLDDIKKWKSGHMKDADYTQKTQTLAKERKELQTKAEKIDQTLEFLNSMDKDIESLVMGDLKDVDLNALLEDNTQEYLKTKERMDSRKGKLGELRQKFSELQSARIAESQRQLSDSLGWSDPEKRQSDITAITAYVEEQGITDDEFMKVTSPKIMQALLKAAKYEKLTKDKAVATKKVKQAPKTSKPSTTTTKAPLKPWERMYGTD